MGSKRYEKYSDPLTPVQKRELSHKEYKPDGEKRHLKLISYSPEQLVNILCDNDATIFDKSIAKEEILRRLVRNQKREQNKKTKKSKQYKQTKNKQKKWEKFEQTAKKTGIHIGSEYETKYNEFIKNGGDVNACPFD